MTLIPFLLMAVAAAEGPPVLIIKSDGTEANGVLLSFEKGSYRLVTKAGKELSIPAVEIDLIRFPRTKSSTVEKLDLPPARRPEEGDSFGGPNPDPVLRGIPSLKEEGKLQEFIQREEDALRNSTTVWEAMRHLVRLRHAADVEYGRDTPEALRQMRRHLETIHDPELKKELKERLRWLGGRRGAWPPRGRPPR